MDKKHLTKIAHKGGKISGIKRRKESIEKYDEAPNYCKKCGEKICVRDKEKSSETKRKIFCSSVCSASFNNSNRLRKIIEKKCPVCMEKYVGNGKTCSRRCANEKKYIEFIDRWKKGEETGTKGITLSVSNNIRKYLFKKYNGSCQICGWNKKNKFTNNVPLQVHHMFGDARDNKENNLQLLCPNCHSLTATYMALNKNSKRVR